MAEPSVDWEKGSDKNTANNKSKYLKHHLSLEKDAAFSLYYHKMIISQI